MATDRPQAAIQHRRVFQFRSSQAVAEPADQYRFEYVPGHGCKGGRFAQVPGQVAGGGASIPDMPYTNARHAAGHDLCRKEAPQQISGQQAQPFEHKLLFPRHTIPSSHPIYKRCFSMDLQTLQQECLACRRCPLCESRTHVVFGQGAPNAEVLFVGEGPGANEDEQGQPFVGRSGQLLDHYLEAVDLDREKNVYIANIVKCRPPQNRDPLPEESAACLPWLRQQFQLLRPRIVVCLGRVAAQQMIDPGFSVSRDHGKFFDKHGTLFMATYHPAALLRYPANKPAVFGDFVALREKITQVCTHTY